MLRFAVFDEQSANGAPAPGTGFALAHAHIIGKDENAIVGRVTLEKGMICVQTTTNEAAALALQVNIDAAGVLTVQTCLLPPCARPYLLSLELARHRIMLLLNKLEEWGLSDLPADHEVMRGLDEARELFTRASVAMPAGSEPCPLASALGWKSLTAGIEAGEALTLLNAQRGLATRLSMTEPPAAPAPGTAPGTAPGGNGGASDAAGPIAPLGCAVPPDQFAEPLQRILSQHFDFICCPMRWASIEPEEGRYSFAATDRWIEWAVRSSKLRVVAGPLLDLSRRALPKWLGIWEHDYQAVRDFAYEHVRRVVTRYRRTVSRWTIVSGINTNEAINLSIEQMVDLTRLAVMLTRKLHPESRIVLELAQPFGEHVTTGDRSVAPFLFAQVARESGVQFDALGVKIQVGDPSSGRSTRDLLQFSALLDRLWDLEKPIHVTALGAPGETIPAARQPDGGAPAGSGWWRGPWNGEAQAAWMAPAISVALGKPFVASVCWQALYDTPASPEMPFGGLITGDGRPRPSLARIGQISQALRARKSPIGEAEQVMVM